MKLTISLDDRLVERLDSFADEHYFSRSGLISTACTQYLVQQEALSAIPKIYLLMEQVMRSGEMDEETKREFEKFEILSKAIMGK